MKAALPSAGRRALPGVSLRAGSAPPGLGGPGRLGGRMLSTVQGVERPPASAHEMPTAPRAVTAVPRHCPHPGHRIGLVSPPAPLGWTTATPSASHDLLSTCIQGLPLRNASLGSSFLLRLGRASRVPGGCAVQCTARPASLPLSSSSFRPPGFPGHSNPQPPPSPPRPSHLLSSLPRTVCPALGLQVTCESAVPPALPSHQHVVPVSG